VLCFKNKTTLVKYNNNLFFKRSEIYPMVSESGRMVIRVNDFRFFFFGSGFTGLRIFGCKS